MQWEYRFAELSVLTDKCEEQLNQLGKEGWEVIKLDWDDRNEFAIALLKRPKFDWGEFKTLCCKPPALEVMSDEEREEVGPAEVESVPD